VTRREIELLKYKEKEGTLSKKEARKLRKHRESGGRTADETYGDKHRNYE